MEYAKITDGKIVKVADKAEATRIVLTLDDWAQVKQRSAALKQTREALQEIADTRTHEPPQEWGIVSAVETYRPHPCRYENEHLWICTIQTPLPDSTRPAVDAYVRRYIGVIYNGPRGDAANETDWNAAEVLEVLIGYQQGAWQASVACRHLPQQAN